MNQSGVGTEFILFHLPSSSLTDIVKHWAHWMPRQEGTACQAVCWAQTQSNEHIDTVPVLTKANTQLLESVMCAVVGEG